MTDGGSEVTVPDFFVSYTGVDRAWAVWIAWTLEAAGYRVVIQEWDFRAGAHFVAEVHRASMQATRTVAVLSAAYLNSEFTAPEWQEAWRADPNGQDRKLLVFRIEECPRPGLLAQIVSRDLFGIPREEARRVLVAAAVGERGKPATAPDFPGGPAGAGVAVGGPVFPPDLPAVWNAPPQLAHFVGRDELIDQVHTQLAASGSVAVTALEGMGGVGKTALAIEYAYRHAAGYDAVWWIPAENPDLIGEHLVDLAVELGVPSDAPAGAILAVLRRRYPRYLLIADNADDTDQIMVLRPAGVGRLLVTSRRVGFDTVGAVIGVPTFDRAESVALLTARFPTIDPVVAGRIAKLLGDLALAVEQAAAYLRRTGMPSGDYAALLDRRLGDMLTRGRVADRPAITIGNLWELSVTRLRDESPAAVELLELCALAGAEPVPLDLFTGGVDRLDDGPLKTAVSDGELAWPETVGALTAYSLTRRENNALATHRLVQAATRRAMSSEVRQARAGTLVRLLRGILPTDIMRNPDAWPVWRVYLPHVMAVLGHTGADATMDGLSWLCDRTATYLGEHAQLAA
ncbi:FxSxx-COOH system tetratricopeptide repeat protein, partial [Frankia sp. Cr2]|uniref:FxSxx-COOH system tetratricopeptide repeat protein n=1 Tax=Frankia sp. Cr2 TaxID=3073932 RepID=UPI002AD1D715